MTKVINPKYEKEQITTYLPTNMLRALIGFLAEDPTRSYAQRQRILLL